MKKTLGSLLLGTFLLAVQAAQASDAFVTTPLNFRDGPGKAYALRGTIPAGEIVGVRRCTGNWCEINYGPRIGWASAAYLAFRSGQSVYQSYNNYDGYDRPSQPTYNIIIGNDYYDDWHDRHRHPHGHNDHRPPPPPPPSWDGSHRPRPPRPGPGMPPPPNSGPGGAWHGRPEMPPPGAH